MEDLIPLIEEKIKNDGEVIFTPKGTSMLPMLRNNQDTVTLKKAIFPLKKYQLAFYLRDNGQYVLHRVVKVEESSYVMRGDNQLYNEPEIRNDQIIGVVSHFTRKGKKYNGNEITYILYSRIWVGTVEIRRLINRGRKIAGRIKRKILRAFQ
jgi:hypothetical protein